MANRNKNKNKTKNKNMFSNTFDNTFETKTTLKTKPKVYIDGQSGTTGLQIYERIEARDDLELLKIDEDKRHDVSERKKLLNAANVVFLCLPDEEAMRAVSLVDNPNVVIIDASTAHRTKDGWTYGFAELSPHQRRAIAHSSRIANPGCHATGFIATVAPLVTCGIIPKNYPLTCYSLTGYSGGGKKMIAEYESTNKPDVLSSPGIYGLSLTHKHLPEMTKICDISFAPAFTPIVDDYYKGMATTVFLQNRFLNKCADSDSRTAPTSEEIREVLKTHYANEHFVKVLDAEQIDSTIYASELAGTNYLHIAVCGNNEQTALIAIFDNLGKGASGAAVQNMNIALGLDETVGLE